MKHRLLFLLLLASFAGISLSAQITAKREFRGAWIHIIHQDQYRGMSSRQLRDYYTTLLDSLAAYHINALIFQVRPCADALYPSELEPWTSFLSGTQGIAPDSDFDPMAFMIEEAHKRNMEFHAWLNPYRVTSTAKEVLHSSHIYHQHPHWFVRYGNQLLFDPGLPESRAFICQVVQDIVKRYDVDAIHMDDYFYPYPIKGVPFPDDYSFSYWGPRQGFAAHQRDDWRRNNVNTLIQDIKRTIVLTKPWVRFGISPFGIYRNQKSTPDASGSDTNGLQNYDDLYADVKLWVEKGWIDYNIPQIYWEIGHAAADYETLIRWWARNNYGAHLYIGQSITRTVNVADTRVAGRNQLTSKMALERSLPGVYGNCWWPGYDLFHNTGGIADSLRTHYQRYPALIPAYLHMHDRRPKEVKKLKAEWNAHGYTLHWQRNGDPRNPETGQYFVIYRFGNKEKTNLEDPSKIVAITRETSYLLPYKTGQEKYRYVVTTVDRFHNESKKGKSRTVKL